MSENNIISLDQFREKKNKEKEEAPIMGTLVWLHCPTCETLEYTEIVAPHGRNHKCGTLVEETAVEVDLRAEVTICLHNIEELEKIQEKKSKSKLQKLFSKPLTHVLKALRMSEETYLARLNSAAGIDLEPYPKSREDLWEKLPIQGKNQFGIFVSEFRFEPEKRFPASKDKK